MNVFFDTSVLVPTLVDQLSNHSACFAVFKTYTSGGNLGYCSTHGLAECYSVLTSLPLPRKVSTVEARLLIEESIIKNINVVALTQSDYSQAITAVSNNGLAGGIIYDALHAAGCGGGSAGIDTMSMTRDQVLSSRFVSHAYRSAG